MDIEQNIAVAYLSIRSLRKRRKKKKPQKESVRKIFQEREENYTCWFYQWLFVKIFLVSFSDAF